MAYAFERRQSFRWQQLHFYLTPFAVAHLTLLDGTQVLLVSQLDADFVATSARSLGLSIVKARPPVSSVMSLSNCGPSRSSDGGSVAVINADGIDHYVGFLDHRLDFIFRVAAVIVAPSEMISNAFLGYLAWRILLMPM